jgi:hypothetical protein
MTTTALILAEAAEKSKTPFYIAGGAFAAWALIVSALGITNHDFPGKAGRAPVIGLSLVLMVAAMSTAVITS